MNTPTTDYIFNTPKARYSFGYFAGINDAERGHDRALIPTGKTFCLPVDDADYCEGYADGHSAIAKATNQ